MNATRTVYACNLTVNGVPFCDDLPPTTILLDLLRERLGLTTLIQGCDHGHCGGCTVLVDGAPVKSCLILAISVPQAEVLTIDALPRAPDLHHVREVLGRAGPPLCSECMPARILSILALAGQGRTPSAQEIGAFMRANPCGCGRQAHAEGTGGQVADMSRSEHEDVP
ncbi:(2Fe-2S)-binding protein [Komagataeibacter sp. FNDCF1]|uniref:(2Fe-2S)-binding protein n=1 Tax=Komagataeibacter sp. FNDCF1 TaxID=2878681 RepID=UPI001E30EB3C|nr:2Fe-2S iron-sulfur cluster-binding protein [Komagataeibacter sp. FNDCF1]MCE2563214.1 2Fe-2S iron-sulfur cluster binding domain-containing protein [Komagataeibacter sp. FNDCF1]